MFQANSIFILLSLGLQSDRSDFAEIKCKVWLLSTSYVVISFNKILFVIGFSQGFKLCAQKTEVVEMDGILKIKCDLNRSLGNVIMPWNTKTHFSFKMKICAYVWNFLEKNPFFWISIKISCTVKFSSFFWCMGLSWNHKCKSPIKILVRQDWILKIILHFPGTFHAWMHIHFQLLQS